MYFDIWNPSGWLNAWREAHRDYLLFAGQFDAVLEKARDVLPSEAYDVAIASCRDGGVYVRYSLDDENTGGSCSGLRKFVRWEERRHGNTL